MGEEREEVEIGGVEHLIAVRRFPGWAELSTAELAAVSAVARARLLRAGERGSGEGAFASALIVVEGALAVRRGARTIGHVGPWGSLGAVLAFAHDAGGLERYAIEESLVLELDVDDLEDLFEDRAGILARALAALCRETIALRRTRPGDAGYPRAGGSGERVPPRPLDVVERLFYLRKDRTLRHGRIDAMAALAEAARELRAPAGARLWHAGDESGTMICVASGRVAAAAPEGQRFELGPADLVGGLDTLAGAPRWYGAEVVEPLVGLALDRDELLDVWEDHPDLGVAVLRAISTSLLALIEGREQA